MNKQRGFAGIGALIILVIWALAIGGWVANIVKFIGLLDGAVTAMFIARGVGIVFAPLGSVLGYF